MQDHSCTHDKAGRGWVHAWTGSEGTGRYGPFAHATSRSYQYLKIQDFHKRHLFLKVENIPDLLLLDDSQGKIIENTDF